MKLLWVKSGGLVPLDTGGKIRSFNLAKQLARHHDVTLFTFYPEHAGDAHPQLEATFSRVICLPLRLPARASLRDCVDYARNLFSLRPHSMTKYCRPEVARRLRQLLEAEKFDAIICDFLLTAAVIPWDLPCSPVIVFTHNVEAMIWQRHYEVSTNPLWKAISYREYRTMARVERLYLRKADHVLTVSENDRQVFSGFLDPVKISVIPTGVDTSYFRPAAGEQANTLVFTGSMDWLPNEDGIFWFAEQVLPRIRRAVPDVTLEVVGRSPSPRLQRLAIRNPALRIAGRVEDVRPYLAEAAVCVVPLRIGGGTRIKIFEAMAMGKAVVSTTVGAEGLPVKPGRDLVLADSPEQFASGVVRLLQQPELRRGIGATARELVHTQYSWEAAAARLQGLLCDQIRLQAAARAAGRAASR